ncbi:MAG: 6-pyruvoyl trahydropterin synthase family protein [Pirellula sp.]|jgi:6-pyruvoyltetrahydropterin/6-carboxytetrahydropterin synthase
MSLTIMRRIKFCAGHRLFGHGGKCENFHGHNYVCDFFVTSDTQDEVGRVIDFSDLKARCKGWIDEHWDHSFLICKNDDNAISALKMVTPCRMFILPYNPTAENMAKYLLEEVCPVILQGSGAQATRVRIWETDESYAEASVDLNNGLVSTLYQEASSED